MVQAKTDALKSQKQSEEAFNKAIEAMKIYSGHGEDSDENIQ